MDWNQATAFCQWAGKRLPTRVEWQVYCGGSYLDSDPPSLEASAWVYSTPASSAQTLGFRCAK